MIKTLIFDLGGVIVPLDFKRGYTLMEQRCPHPASEIPQRIRASGLVTPFELGEMGAREFVAQLSSALDLQATYEEFCGLWTSIFPPYTLIPEEFLESLRGRYRLLLLSNTNSIHYEMIRENYPMVRRFDHYVLSYQVGAAKPSARIYQEALAHARCEAGECLFIDDLKANVEAARTHGIQAVQFESFDQLRREMAARGVV